MSGQSPRKRARACSTAWQRQLLLMLPEVKYWLRKAFHYLPVEARGEAVQDSLVKVVIALHQLNARGKANQAHAYTLARFAAAQTRDGRQAATRLNINDVASPHCQHRKGVQIKSLTRYDFEQEAWGETLIADRRAGPAELAAMRIDFPAYLDSLSASERKVAVILAGGEPTSQAARACGVSPSRISQLRRTLMRKWYAFHNEEVFLAAH